MLSVDNLCKQIGPRSGPIKCQALIWIKSVSHWDDIPERIFQKVDFEKNQQMTKSMLIEGGQITFERKPYRDGV